VGAAEMVGMAAGQWQSDSEHGAAAAAVIGVATGAGCIVPAVPFALLPPTAAAWCSAALVLAVTAGIARLRAGRGRVRAAAQSFLILAAVAVVVLLVHVLTPGGGA
jgi:VIT1/CCC1 family predicted Fe2+/Mn2+ transporter